MEDFSADTSHLEQQLRAFPSPYVVMAVGIPGSGKTTVLKKLAGDLDATYVSSDEIRAEVTGSEHDQSANAQVWAMAYRRVKAALQKGNSVVIDATHTSYRSSAIKKYRLYGAVSIIALNFHVPLALAKQRNAARERTVDAEVLEKMNAALERRPASIDEGFDAVIHYKSST